MSADNWAICPECKANEIREHADAKKTAEESYGKVPADEYLKLLVLSQIEPEGVTETLREDYDIGIDEDGFFEVSYTGECENCNFKFSYKFKSKATKGEI